MGERVALLGTIQRRRHQGRGEGVPKKVQKTVTSILQSSKFCCSNGDKGGGGSEKGGFCGEFLNGP